MKKVLLPLALLGLAAAPAYATAPVTGAGLNPTKATFAKEDCKEGEKWNEETQKCEAEG